ncbi:MAG: endolytic transglycosylase MltG [Candidatus Acidiferrum sp.]
MKAFLIIVLVIVLAAAAVAGYLWLAIEKPYGVVPPEGVFVEIPHGASQRGVSHLLRDKGIIRSSLAFELYARRHPKRSLLAGQYFFDRPLSGKAVYWKIANGEIYEQPFTVKEGDTMFDIAHNLDAGKYMKAADFLIAAQDASQIQDFAPGAKTLEGFLFPATYNLPLHASPTDLTTMMVHKFREALQRIAPDHLDPATPGTPLLSIITLASLVEAETPKPDERPLVAGVYTNRLRMGMLLQCDPTVIYALKQVDKYKPPLLIKDLSYPSPYNTYVHSGLPPGPIGNPGETSIRAAIAPAPTDFLYFVANTQGGHFFASTLAEHNQNVAKYHRLLNGEPADPPVPDAHPAHTAGSAHKGKR